MALEIGGGFSLTGKLEYERMTTSSSDKSFGLPWQLGQRDEWQRHPWRVAWRQVQAYFLQSGSTDCRKYATLPMSCLSWILFNLNQIEQDPL